MASVNDNEAEMATATEANKSTLELAKAEAPDEPSGPPPAPVLEMRISWNPDSKRKCNVAYVKLLREEGWLDKIPQEVVVKVLPSMHGPEVRDRVRLAFQLHDHEGDIESLTLYDDEKWFPVVHSHWPETLEQLAKTPHARFTCHLREREDGGNTWECSGPPAALEE
jgi:hypothetical protein